MLSLSNWLCLGIGLGLGLSFNRLRRQSSNLVDSSSPPPVAAIEELGQPILEQLKAYQLAYHLAHETSQFKAGFLARVSHELRSPLSSLIGLHQLILADLCDDPEEEREFVAKANESALKFVHLLDKILAVSRIEHGTNPLEMQPLQLSEILEEVYQLTHLLAVDRNLQLCVSPPDPEIHILADRRWLRQVLVSLVDASITQMEQGSICLSTNSTLPESICIWIDIELSEKIWTQEAVDLLLPHTTISSVQQKAALSPGTILLLNQTLLELMNGRIEIFPIDTDTNSYPQTRIQLTVDRFMSPLIGATD